MAPACPSDPRGPLALARWDFSWLERRWPGAGYEAWERILGELVERGDDAVRIDPYPHLLAAAADREWTLRPGCNQQGWGSPALTRAVVREPLLAFVRCCRAHGLRAARCSCFRQDAADVRRPLRAPQGHAAVWVKALRVLEQAGRLDDRMLYVDLANAFPLRQSTPCLPPAADGQALRRASAEGTAWRREVHCPGRRGASTGRAHPGGGGSALRLRPVGRQRGSGARPQHRAMSWPPASRRRRTSDVGGRQALGLSRLGPVRAVASGRGLVPGWNAPAPVVRGRCPGRSDRVELLSQRRPRPDHRAHPTTFVISVTAGRAPVVDILEPTDLLLIRALGNQLTYLGPAEEACRPPAATSCATPARGGNAPSESGEDDFGAVLDRVRPLADSQLVIDNRSVAELPPGLIDGSVRTDEMAEASRRLKDRLPAPFPLAALLPGRDFSPLQRLLQLGGLRDGNVRVREPGLGFWMTASGVDKGRLERIGAELLVRRYDSVHNALEVRVPPAARSRRVSVDAIWPCLIHDQFPAVSAILHVCAWMHGVPSRDVNDP